MNREKWNPGHALNKGYPFAGVESEKQLPNRIKIVLETDNVITLDFQSFGEPLNDTQAQLDFMISRAFDFQEALKTAEQQIKELLSEDPFLPEDFGFERFTMVEKTDGPPVRTYTSIYDNRFILYREAFDVNDPEPDTTKWVLLKKREDNTFDKIDIKLPCHRIAYAAFSALGVVMEPEQSEGSEAPVMEEAPVLDTEKILDEYDSDLGEEENPNSHGAPDQ